MRKNFQYDDANISYAIEGKGMPVVLLHGFAETGNIWDLQVQFLREHCMLIVPDLPGSGQLLIKKNDVNNKCFSTLEYYADCMHALLQHENISQCIMLGHSMGGYITLAFVEKYRNLIKAFGLINSTAFADSEEKKTVRKKGIDVIEEYGPYHFLKSTIPNLFSEKFRKENAEQVNSLVEQAKTFSKEALQNYYRAMMQRPDRTHVLIDSKASVIFIIGTEDIAAPLNDVLQQVHLPEISYIHILENVGHMSMWEAPTPLNNHLLAFINNEML